MTALTKKQESFALAYIKADNASDAYRAAYKPKRMTAKTVNEEASRLLAHPKIAARIDDLRAPAAAQAGLDLLATLNQARCVSQFDIRKLYDADGLPKPIHELDDDTAFALSHMGRGGPVPFDKLKALDMSFKNLGLYERDNKQRGDSLSLEVSFRGGPKG